MKPIYQSILIAVFGASLGFGASQITIVSRVAETATRLEEFKQRVESDRQASQESFRELIGLVRTVIQSNSDFITVVKMQNDILARKNSSSGRTQ